MKKVLVGKFEFCDCHTIQDALDILKEESDHDDKELVILEGTYVEKLTIYLSNIVIRGIGTVEIIGYDYALRKLNNEEENGTFRTATVFIEGINIRLENLTIKNLAGQGEIVGQAVALFNFGSETLLENCTLSAYQDTLCTGPLPDFQKDGTHFKTPSLHNNFSFCSQVYKNCLIEGTIDFIFGGAEAHFYNCEIKSRARINPNDIGFVTAASTEKNQLNGFVFENCFLTSEKNVNNVYLGRPWRPFAKTKFSNCFFGDHIHPVGWDNWENSVNEQTACYQEINNHSDGRVSRPDWIDITNSIENEL